MKYVAEGCGGELVGGSPSGTIARVCTDSRQAQPGDLVIVTGKGHERSMCFGTTETPWSDQDAVMRVLNGLASAK